MILQEATSPPVVERLARETGSARPREARFVETAVGHGGKFREVGAQAGELGARRFGHEGTAVASSQLRERLQLEQPVE